MSGKKRDRIVKKEKEKMLVNRNTPFAGKVEGI
jgi:hypothetical protein